MSIRSLSQCILMCLHFHSEKFHIESNAKSVRNGFIEKPERKSNDHHNRMQSSLQFLWKSNESRMNSVCVVRYLLVRIVCHEQSTGRYQDITASSATLSPTFPESLSTLFRDDCNQNEYQPLTQASYFRSGTKANGRTERKDTWMRIKINVTFALRIVYCFSHNRAIELRWLSIEWLTLCRSFMSNPKPLSNIPFSSTDLRTVLGPISVHLDEHIVQSFSTTWN